MKYQYLHHNTSSSWMIFFSRTLSSFSLNYFWTSLNWNNTGNTVKIYNKRKTHLLLLLLFITISYFQKVKITLSVKKKMYTQKRLRHAYLTLWFPFSPYNFLSVPSYICLIWSLAVLREMCWWGCSDYPLIMLPFLPLKSLASALQMLQSPGGWNSIDIWPDFAQIYYC